MTIATHHSQASRRVSILGSTGSIGCNTVKALLAAKEQFSVEVITAGANVSLLAQQAIQVKAKRAVIADEACYAQLKELLSGSGIEVAAGEKAVEEAGAIPSDWVMSAIVGAAGLKPTLAAIRQGTTVALANKECLVCAGELMMQEVRKCNATLIPVDSEHSAVMQAFGNNKAVDIHKITLTASGGPFRQSSLQEMIEATPEQAVNHPNWSMGVKISVDSATMMNKGLELIEAYHLFPVSLEQIEVVVHPESVVHGMVEYVDGSVLAQLGSPDMITPIVVALAWPERMKAPHQPLDLLQLGSLTFEAVDLERFPALTIAREAVQKNSAMPIVMNAANEVAVAAFLQGEIGFMQIVRTVDQLIDKSNLLPPSSLDDVIALDREAHRLSRAFLKSYSVTAA